jgi:hypothetical protein
MEKEMPCPGMPPFNRRFEAGLLFSRDGNFYELLAKRLQIKKSRFTFTTPYEHNRIRPSNTS